MRVTVTQIDAAKLDDQWDALRQHIRDCESELVLLPEMCFAPWFCADPAPDETVWNDAVASHERWLERLHELDALIVVGTAPRTVAGDRQNVAFVWSAKMGLRWDHAKTYLPDDEGFWEANWYSRAPIDFQARSIGSLRLGIMICTEMWFLHHARDYGKAGIQLLFLPRSTPSGTNDKWLAGGRTAAVVSGAYSLSSNHAGCAGDMELGGCGWICDPDGAVLATTDADSPFVTLELDLARADAAKSTYPRYVDDSPLP